MSTQVAGTLSARNIGLGVTPQEIIDIALANRGDAWVADGCAAFVWGVTNLAGLPFFDLENKTANDDPTSPQHTDYIVPHSTGVKSGTADVPGDGWYLASSSSSVADLTGTLQPGDVVRVYKAGNTNEDSVNASGQAIAHSFIVVSNSGGNVQVVDNWTGVISEHSLSDITNSWAPGGQFAAAFVSRIDSTWVASNVSQNTIVGDAYGDWSSLVAQPPAYTYTTIDLGTSTAAFDINNLGQIVGDFTDPKAHAFIYSINAAPLIIKDDPFGRNGTDGYGIDDSGHIVGDYADGFLNHAFMYAGGTTYSTLSGRFAWDINDVGQIVGDYAQYSSPTGTAFIRNVDGSYTDIRYSQSILTSAQGINDNGEVVGYFQDGIGYHGFTYLNGNYDLIPDAASQLADAAPNQTFATGVNDAGWIAGYYYDVSGAAHSFLDINGTYEVIGDELHAIGVFAQGINDAGQIVGYYSNSSGTHAFLATVSDNRSPVASAIAADANEDTNNPIVKLVASFIDADLSDTFTFATGMTGTLGLVTNNHDGTFTYDPNRKFESLSVGDTATDTFKYTVDDGRGGTSTATATVTIHGENDPPSALLDAMVVQKGAVVTANAAHGVLINDSDPDKHDTLHVSKVNGLSTNVGHAIIGAYGMLTLNADGSYSYSANKNIPGLTNKAGVQDEFAYSIDDGHGGTASSTLTVTVQTQQALNKSPVLSIHPLDANKDEGNSGTTPFTFVVTRDDNTAATTSVDWKVGPANGVTADGQDFTGGLFPAGTVTFGVGELSKVITVNVHGDTLYESNGKTENFVVTLSNPSTGATISSTHNSAVGHIHNDDARLQTAANIFKALGTDGEMVALAQLAQAAYHLIPNTSIEKTGVGINLPNGLADAAYALLPAGMQVLTSSELPSLALRIVGDANFPAFGLVDGIYLDGNAAALIARSSDSLFISFRGTNDVDLSSFGFSPDTKDWTLTGMSSYYDLLKPLITAVDGYLATHQDITHVYVTGHSLGASMAQNFMTDHAGSKFQAVTFANPGFPSAGPLDDPRITDIAISTDPVPFKYAVNGDIYQIVDYDGNSGGGLFGPHDMALYRDAVQFLASKSDSIPQSGLAANGHQDLVKIFVDIAHPGPSSILQTDPWTVGLPSGVVPSPFVAVPTFDPRTDRSVAPKEILGVTGGGTLTGGAGNDAFTFAPGFGQVMITNFHPGEDIIQIESSLFKNARAVAQHIAPDPQDPLHSALITFNTNDAIELHGNTAAQLIAQVQHHGADYLFQVV